MSQGMNPNEPFIGSDGLEYASLADKLLGRPLDSWRNMRIQEHRASGRSEASIRQWIKGFDGEDPKVSENLSQDNQTTRAHRAWWAVDDFDEACALSRQPDIAAHTEGVLDAVASQIRKRRDRVDV